MSKRAARANQPRPATSDAIPRAVEFLILTFIRWVCFGLALLFGLLSVAAWLNAWTWWVAIPSTFLTLASMLCGAANRPRGRFHFDHVGPSIVVPGSGSHSREQSDGELPQSRNGS